MQKTILITGSTDGIGLETAKMLNAGGHHVLLHGRSPAKLKAAENALANSSGSGRVSGYIADLSNLVETKAFIETVIADHPSIDVLINNAGVYSTPNALTPEGLDVRFVVNTLAPYLLAQRLIPALGPDGRIVNLSSAAQAPVSVEALAGKMRLNEGAAYAQSKLAITMWSRLMAEALGENGPAVIAVNPGSLLGSKMVKDAFGIAGGDIRVGADILCRAALSDEFADASGKYFDNDSGRFAPPHPDALDDRKSQEVVVTVERLLADLVGA